jgi:hypothetical protein
MKLSELAAGLLVICGPYRSARRERDGPTKHVLNVDKHGGFAPGLAARQQPERGRRETTCASSAGPKVEASYVVD